MKLEPKQLSTLEQIKSKGKKFKDSDAAFELGKKLYEEGDSLEDASDALLCFKASKREEAAFYRGLCYYLGKGDRRDIDRSYLEFRAASKSGIKQAHAYAALSNILSPYGYNAKDAIDFTNKGLEAGDPYAKFPQALLAVGFKGLQNPDDEAAKRLANQLRKEGYLSESRLILGLRYEFGLVDREEDLAKNALEEYKEAVAHDPSNFEAINRAAWNLKYIFQNPNLAYAYWAMGAVAGDGWCLYNYAEKFNQSSNDYYNLVFEAHLYGVVDATEQIAILYHNGIGRERDHLKALEFHQIAYDRGNTLAAYNLGILYEGGGNYVKANIKKAKQFYLEAYRRGYQGAEGKCRSYGLIK